MRPVFLLVGYGLTALSIAAPFATRAEVPLACRLCVPAEKNSADEPPRPPLRIEVEAALDFSRIAQTGEGGEVGIDPLTGARRVSAGLSDLGGMALRGSARLTGQPFAPVFITLPNRVSLRSTSGASAEVVDIKSDLSAAPILGADGTLRFAFGGRLVLKGAVSGQFRGTIPITADYQ
jgi:Domain of unknown function (DUF4402)